MGISNQKEGGSPEYPCSYVVLRPSKRKSGGGLVWGRPDDYFVISRPLPGTFRKGLSQESLSEKECAPSDEEGLIRSTEIGWRGGRQLARKPSGGERSPPSLAQKWRSITAILRLSLGMAFPLHDRPKQSNRSRQQGAVERQGGRRNILRPRSDITTAGG